MLRLPDAGWQPNEQQQAIELWNSDTSQGQLEWLHEPDQAAAVGGLQVQSLRTLQSLLLMCSRSSGAAESCLGHWSHAAVILAPAPCCKDANLSLPWLTSHLLLKLHAWQLEPCQELSRQSKTHQRPGLVATKNAACPLCCASLPASISHPLVKPFSRSALLKALRAGRNAPEPASGAHQDPSMQHGHAPSWVIGSHPVEIHMHCRPCCRRTRIQQRLSCLHEPRSAYLP